MHAERMRYIRVDLLGISQREMAERMNAIQPGLRMSPTSISRYERGDIKPSLGTQEVYKRLEAQALNVPGQHPTGMTAPLAINFIRRLGYSEVRSMLSAASVSNRARAALVSVTVSSLGRPRPRCGSAISASAGGPSVMCEPI